MNDVSEQTTASDRVPWPQLLAYGAGGVISIALYNVAGQLMTFIGNISLGLSAFWLSVIMLLPKIWDAFSDPLMGHISDNTRSRWGRRRPYLLFGGIAVALSFVAMWWIPRGSEVEAWFATESAYNWFQLSCILAAMVLFYTSFTVFEIPHGALGMEMSADYHERTRLFSAKSFLGNCFALGAPWLIAAASLEFFSGPGGDLVDGMRFVSIAIAGMLIPLAIWWFRKLKEPAFTLVQQQPKSKFWEDMKTTAQNKAFVQLVLIVFTLAMGFNFVNIFGHYIKVFYLYGGNVAEAGILLGVDGTVWAITALWAVFPLNWLGRQVGKIGTLRIAIGLMCAAQLLRIVCYNPAAPYLVLIPTMLLSAGMLMFFTLGSSMVGDLCDLDELESGTRSEGSYYSVYGWFIKLGTALAGLVMGGLLVITAFDERQNVVVDSLRGEIEIIVADTNVVLEEPDSGGVKPSKLSEHLDEATRAIESTRELLRDRVQEEHTDKEHYEQLVIAAEEVAGSLQDLKSKQAELVRSPAQLQEVAKSLLLQTAALKMQSPRTLFRLIAVEISLPIALCIVSLWLTRGYPLTESRSQEITRELKERRGGL